MELKPGSDAEAGTSAESDPRAFSAIGGVKPLCYEKPKAPPAVVKQIETTANRGRPTALSKHACPHPLVISTFLCQ